MNAFSKCCTNLTPTRCLHYGRRFHSMVNTQGFHCSSWRTKRPPLIGRIPRPLIGPLDKWIPLRTSGSPLVNKTHGEYQSIHHSTFDYLRLSIIQEKTFTVPEEGVTTKPKLVVHRNDIKDGVKRSAAAVRSFLFFFFFFFAFFTTVFYCTCAFVTRTMPTQFGATVILCYGLSPSCRLFKTTIIFSIPNRVGLLVVCVWAGPQAIIP